MKNTSDFLQYVWSPLPSSYGWHVTTIRDTAWVGASLDTFVFSRCRRWTHTWLAAFLSQNPTSCPLPKHSGAQYGPEEFRYFRHFSPAQQWAVSRIRRKMEDRTAGFFIPQFPSVKKQLKTSSALQEMVNWNIRRLFIFYEPLIWEGVCFQMHVLPISANHSLRTSCWWGPGAFVAY